MGVSRIQGEIKVIGLYLLFIILVVTITAISFLANWDEIKPELQEWGILK